MSETEAILRYTSWTLWCSVMFYCVLLPAAWLAWRWFYRD